MIRAPTQGFLFTDASPGDLLISTSSDVQDGNILLGVRKWAHPAALTIDRENRVEVSRGLSINDGADLCLNGGGNLRLTAGGNFGIRSGDGSDIFGVDASGSIHSIHADANIYASRNITVDRNLCVVGSSRFGSPSRPLMHLIPSVRRLHVDAENTDVRGKMNLRGELDAVGRLIVRPPFPDDEQKPDRTKDIITAIDDSGIVFMRDTQITGSAALEKGAVVRGGGGLTVSSHKNEDVIMHVDPDAFVQMNADLSVMGDRRTTLQGDFTVERPSSSSSPSSSSTPYLFDVRDHKITANRPLEVTRGLRLSGGDRTTSVDGTFVATGLSPFQVNGNKPVDFREHVLTVTPEYGVRVMGDLRVFSNVSITGETDICGDFRLLRRGEDLMLSVKDNEGMVCEIPTRMRDGMDIERGNLRVLNGRFEINRAGTNLLSVTGSSFDVRRDTRIEGDTRLVGALRINRPVPGTVNEETLMSIGGMADDLDSSPSSDGLFVFRDAIFDCNLDVVGSLQAGSGNFSVDASHLTLRRDATIGGSLSTADLYVSNSVAIDSNLVVGNGLRVFAGDYPIISTSNDPPAFEVSDENGVTINRDLAIRSTEMEFVGNAMRVLGDLTVDPTGSKSSGTNTHALGGAFGVNDDGVVIRRDLEVTQNSVLRKNLRVDTDIRVASNLTVGNELNVDDGALVVSSDEIVVTRDLRVMGACNVNLEGGGNMFLDGEGSLQIQGSGDLALQAGGNLTVSDPRPGSFSLPSSHLFRVTNDVLADPSDAQSPVSTPGNVVVNRAALLSCNVNIGADLKVRGDLEVTGDTDVYGDVHIHDNGTLINESGFLETSTPGVNGKDVLFRVSDDRRDENGGSRANAVQMFRRLDARCNVGIGGELEVSGTAVLEDGVSTYGPLYVRPDGKFTPAALGVEEDGITFARDVSSRCNVSLYGNLNVRRGIKIQSGGVMIRSGNLEVSPSLDQGDGPALTVTDEEINVFRPFLTSDRVNVRGRMDVGDDIDVARNAIIRGDLMVRPRIRASPSSSADTHSVLSASDDRIDVSRDMMVRCNLTVGGSCDIGGPVRVSSDVDVEGRLRVFPRGSGLVEPALTVSDNRLVVGRTLETDAGIIVTDDAVIGGRMDVGSDVSVRGDLRIIDGSIITDNAIVSGLKVSGDSEFVGPMSIRPGLSDQSEGLSLDDVRLRISRNTFVGCNITAERDVTVFGDARTRGDAFIQGKLRAARDSEMSASLKVNEDLTVGGELVVESGSVYFAGGSDANTILDGILSVRTLGDSQTFGVDDAQITVNRNLSARCNVEVFRDLSVRSNVRVECNVTIGNDVTVGKDATIEENVVVRGGLRVLEGTVVQEPFQITTDDDNDENTGARRTPLFSVDNKEGVVLNADMYANSNLVLEGDLRLATGNVYSPSDTEIVTPNIRLDLSSGGENNGNESGNGTARVMGNLDVDESVKCAEITVSGSGGLRVLGGSGGDGAGGAVIEHELTVRNAGGGGSPNFSSTSSRTKSHVSLEAADGMVLSGGDLRVENGDTHLDGSLSVRGVVSLTSNLAVNGPVEVDGPLVLRSRVTQVLDSQVRRFTGSFRDVCLLRNMDGAEIYGGSYALWIEIVYDQRETKTYCLSVLRDMTRGRWRRCLPITFADGGLNLELEAAIDGSETRFRVVNTGRDVVLPNFTQSLDNDEIPFTFAIMATHNYSVNLAIEKLFTEGLLPIFAQSPFPTTTITQRAGKEDEAYDEETGGGRVGINVPAPQQELDVRGRIQAHDQFLGFSSASVSASVSASSPSYSFTGDFDTGIYQPALDEIAIGTDGVERLRLDKNGLIGIGISSPSERLHVDGKIRSTDQILGILGTASAPAFTFASDSNTGIFSPVPDAVAMSTAGREAARFSPSGNLGVGLTDPEQSLDVNGGIQAREGFLGFERGTMQAPTYAFSSYRDTGTFVPETSGGWAVTTAGKERFRVTDTGNVGVGVQTPSEMLDVAGKTRARDQVLGFPTGSARSPAFSFQGDTQTGWFSAGSRELAASTAGLERFRLSSSGKVGVNIKSPQQDLDVNENVQCHGQYLGFGGGTQASPAYSFTASRSTGTFCPSSDQLAFSTSGVERMRVTSSGNVGINVEVPQEQLDVRARIQARDQFLGFQQGDAARPAYSFTTDNDTGAFQPHKHNWAISTAGRERMRVIPNGNVGIRTQNPVETLDVDGRIRARDQLFGFDGSATLPTFSFTQDHDTGMFSARPNELAFSTYGVERARFDMSGRLGVGVTAPQERLDVAGNIRTDGLILAQPGGGDAIEPSYSFDDDRDTGVFRPSDDQWGVATAGIERLRVIDVGNVGINTTSPEEMLDVAGSVRASVQFKGTRSDSIAAPSFTWSGNERTGMYSPDFDVIGFSTSGTRRMTIDSSGSVGIGVSDPDQSLDVNGNVRCKNGNIIANNIRSATSENEGFVTLTHHYTSNIDSLNNENQNWSNLVPSASALNAAYQDARALRASDTFWSDHVNYWNSAGHLTLQQGVVVGIASRYRNRKTDRRFKFAYRRMSDLPATPRLGFPGIAD